MRPTDVARDSVTGLNDNEGFNNDSNSSNNNSNNSNNNNDNNGSSSNVDMAATTTFPLFPPPITRLPPHRGHNHRVLQQLGDAVHYSPTGGIQSATLLYSFQRSVLIELFRDNIGESIFKQLIVFWWM